MVEPTYALIAAVDKKRIADRHVAPLPRSASPQATVASSSKSRRIPISLFHAMFGRTGTP